jgi:urocanate hydratase
MVNSLDEALRILKNAVRKREAASVGLLGDPADVISEMASRGVVPDIVATVESQDSLAPNPLLQDGMRSLHALGSIILSPFSFTEAPGAIQCVALSGEPTDIQRIDRLFVELFPDDEPLNRWVRTLHRRIRHQGLPARVYRLGTEQRVRFGVAVNRLVASGEMKAPAVIVRYAPKRIKRQSEASKTRERALPSNEKLSALIELSRGATWASMNHDEHGNMQVTSQAVAADGTSEMDERIESVLSA